MNTSTPESSKREASRSSFKDWIPVLVVLATVIPSVIGWSLNESSKRKADDFSRKEERYIALLDSLPGFMTGTEDMAQQGEFMRQLRLCWLYCPDDVITKGQHFLFTLVAESEDRFNQEDRKQALRALVLAIRKDLISREKLTETKLQPEDYIIFSQKTKSNTKTQTNDKKDE